MKKRIIPIIILLTVSAIVYTYIKNKNNNGKLLLSGNVEIDESEISFRIPGQMLKRNVNEGDSVKAGDILAELDSKDYEIAYRQAESNLENVKAVLEELQNGSRKQEVEKAKAQYEKAKFLVKELTSGNRSQDIEVAKAEVENTAAASESAKSTYEQAKADDQRYSNLLSSKVISQREYETYKTRLDNALGAYNQAIAKEKSAKEKYDLLKEGARDEQIKQARESMKSAESDYELVKEGARIEKIKQAEAQVKTAEESLNAAKLKLEYTKITAPFDGIVMSKGAEPGEYVNPGTVIVTIANLDKVWIRAYVNEIYIGKLKLGSEVKVKTDSFPGKEYSGKISFISSETEFTPKQVQTFEERVKLMYKIKVEIENKEKELKPGMPADIILFPEK